MSFKCSIVAGAIGGYRLSIIIIEGSCGNCYKWLFFPIQFFCSLFSSSIRHVAYIQILSWLPMFLSVLLFFFICHALLSLVNITHNIHNDKWYVILSIVSDSLQFIPIQSHTFSWLAYRQQFHWTTVCFTTHCHCSEMANVATMNKEEFFL